MSAVLGVHFFLGDDRRGFDDPFAELVVIPQQQLLPACGFPPNGGIFMRFAVIEGGPGPQGGGPVEGVCLSLADFVEDLEMAQVALVRQPLVVFLHLEIMHALANTHPPEWLLYLEDMTYDSIRNVDSNGTGEELRLGREK